MPINAGPEYFKAQEKFLNSKTREEKIAALEEMIRLCPKHKGTENLLSQLKSKLAKLKKQSEAKTKRKSFAIKKEGDAQVCLIGLTQSGKSTLLNKLTNANAKVSDVPYTTTVPQIGTLDYYGVKIQIIEIPSSFRREYMSIAQNSDGIVLVLKNNSDKHELEKLTSRLNKPCCEIVSSDIDSDDAKEKIWSMLDLIRVYTKERGKKPEQKPLVLKKGSTVRDAVEKIHKDFLKYFKFARIWGSIKFPGEKVGLEHRLKDGDTMEVHIS